MTKLINAIERKLTYTTVQAILIILGFCAASLLFMCLVVSGDVRQLTCLFTAHVLGALYTWRYVRERLDTPMGALVTVLFVINGFTALYVPMHVTAVRVWKWCNKRKGDPGSGADDSNKVYVVLYFSPDHAYVDSVYKDRDAALDRIKLLYGELDEKFGEDDNYTLCISRDGTLAIVWFHRTPYIGYSLREQEVL